MDNLCYLILKDKEIEVKKKNAAVKEDDKENKGGNSESNNSLHGWSILRYMGHCFEIPLKHLEMQEVFCNSVIATEYIKWLSYYKNRTKTEKTL